MLVNRMFVNKWGPPMKVQVQVIHRMLFSLSILSLRCIMWEMRTDFLCFPCWYQFNQTGFEVNKFPESISFKHNNVVIILIARVPLIYNELSQSHDFRILFHFAKFIGRAAITLNHGVNIINICILVIILCHSMLKFSHSNCIIHEVKMY